jgi:hypothetical protein
VDNLIGLLELVAYIVAILGLSAGTTYLVVRLSPSKEAKQARADQDG